LKRGR
jgi:hypothetical protein